MEKTQRYAAEAVGEGGFVLFNKETVPPTGTESGFHPYAKLLLAGGSPLAVTIGTADEFTLPAGSALFLSPYVLYGTAPRSEPAQSLSLNLGTFGADFTASPFWLGVRNLLENGKCGLLYQHAEARLIYRTYRELDNSFSLKYLNKIILLASHLDKKMPENGLIDCRCRIKSGSLHFCQTVNEYINAHITRKGSVAEAAAKAHMSVSNFQQKFRQCFNESFHSYLLKQKIRAACNLLAGTSMTVAEIAEELDFNSPSHFTVIFKQHRRITPAAYRIEAQARDYETANGSVQTA